jgi:dihydroxy-acid dehydratase
MSCRSQYLRTVNYQGDGLRAGTCWDEGDLGKLQILIDTAHGDSHPGSVHLGRLAEEAKLSVAESGGKAALYAVTDMCDGIAMAHDGMNYSLVSREIMAFMYEIHALASPFDGCLFMASCDKSIPAQLMACCALTCLRCTCRAARCLAVLTLCRRKSCTAPATISPRGR